MPGQPAPSPSAGRGSRGALPLQASGNNTRSPSTLAPPWSCPLSPGFTGHHPAFLLPGHREAKPNTRGVFTFPAVGIHHARPSDEGRSCAALAPKTCSAGHLRCPVSVFFTGGNPGTPPCGLRSRFQARGPLWLMERREPQSPALPPRLPQARRKPRPGPAGHGPLRGRQSVRVSPQLGCSRLTAQAGLAKGRSRA